MELFRVPVVDMAIIGALNRKTFDPDADFVEWPGRVLLSETGRRKTIEVFERRLQDEWRHDVVGYSLSYARILELEVRLLEKEWLGGRRALRSVPDPMSAGEKKWRLICYDIRDKKRYRMLSTKSCVAQVMLSNTRYFGAALTIANSSDCDGDSRRSSMPQTVCS